jgi:short-subunit dehydrogenase
MGEWTGKTAVVCGASSGLGLAIAHGLISQGISRLFLVARDPQRLEAAQKELSLAGSGGSATLEISSISADLSCAQSCQNAAGVLRDRLPAADIIIQAAGMSDRGTLQTLSRERLIQLMDANVVTGLHALQYFSGLLEANRGVFVLIGSLSSLFAPRYLGGYSLAKHALAALAQQARLELAERGVHVTLVCPGPIRRDDSGRRYRDLEKTTSDLPSDALLPGGGAKVSGLEVNWLAEQILKDAKNRRTVTIYPKKARWLRLISVCSQSWGDKILLKKTS